MPSENASRCVGAQPPSLVQLGSEPPPRLYADVPEASWLAEGRVVISYHTENLRIRPVFGKGALNVSPRVGHIHVTVDHAHWHWPDASGEPVAVIGLPPGPHSVLIELADPTHKILDSQLIEFLIPDPTASQ
ncbi:MAG: DUF6130 family protein [Sphingomicrobium sp.]